MIAKMGLMAFGKAFNSRVRRVNAEDAEKTNLLCSAVVSPPSENLAKPLRPLRFNFLNFGQWQSAMHHQFKSAAESHNPRGL
jgi:hypothetical protein